MNPRLEGRVALVTGAGQGIGAAIARRLALEGAEVFVSDVLIERAGAVAEDIVAKGARARALRLDVTSAEQWGAAVGEIAQQSTRLDVLVNNAGITIAKSVEELSLEEWRRMMTINMEGPFLGVKASLGLLRETARRTPFGGAIVNMSSVSGIVGTAALAGYTASKAGVRYFSKSIALDFARKGYRIRVNSIHPGLTEGESAELLFESRIRNGLSATREEAMQAWIANYPIGRMGRQEDVAAGVAYLASDDAAFITGTELVIDGGLSA